jgi:predicted hotdog family 3-hydroxylacyl-ACP dehydratase
MSIISPILSGVEVEQYLPQRPPMIMVDRLWMVDDVQMVSGLEIIPELIFVEDGAFREPGLMENVAQTAALGAGFQFRQEGRAISIGFIGAYKDVKIKRPARVSEILHTTLTVKHSVMNCTSYDAVVKINEEVIASMEIKLFIL